MTVNLNLPDIPSSPMFMGDEGKIMTIEWQEFFRNLFDRVGGISGPTSSDMELSEVSETYSTPINYTKRIDELEQQIKVLTIPKSYDKRIDDLEKFVVSEVIQTSINTLLPIVSSVIYSGAGPHTLTSLDFSKNVRIDNGVNNVIVNLPSIIESDIDSWFTVIREGTGSVKVQAVDTDTIGPSLVSGYALSDETRDYPKLSLIVEAIAHWGPNFLGGSYGKWEFY